MTNVFVDPVIVMTLSENESKSAVQQWLTTLEMWLKEALASPYLWLHSLKATEYLQSNDLFPSFALLRRWQVTYQLDINPVQLSKSVNEFFREPERDLKQRLDLIDYDYEVEKDSVKVIPTDFVSRWPALIREHMLDLLTATCVSRCLKHELSSHLRIATLNRSQAYRAIELSAVVIEAIPDFSRPPDNTIAQTIELLLTPDDLLPMIDVMELWHKGETGLSYAIESQFRKDWLENTRQPLRFQIGSGFMESIEAGGLSTNGMFLRKIVKAAAAVIADEAKNIDGYKLHERRESEAANSPQLIRESDKAKAWRLMISKHGAGWRMHYWQISNQQGHSIEFSNIVKENDATII